VSVTPHAGASWYPITAPVGVGDEVGPLVTGGDIEDSVAALLKAWLPRYLVACEAQHGAVLGSTPAPKGWAYTGNVLDKLLSDQLPCVIVMAAGIALGATHREGDGALSATWAVGVAVMFDAAWGLESRRRAQWYVRCMQVALQQRPLHALGQPCKVDWRGESYDQLDFAGSRTYSAAVAEMGVWCREVANTDGGPPPEAVPPGDPTVPFVPWLEVLKTGVTVNNEPLDGSKP